MTKLNDEDLKEMDDEATTERMYMLAKSLKRDTRYLAPAFTVLVVLIGVMIMFTVIFYAQMDLWGTITFIESDVVNCDEFWIDTATCWAFEPHEGIIPEEVVSKMYQSRDSMTLYLWILLVILTPTLLYTWIKLRSARLAMKDVADDYIRDSYFLNMELANPQGRNKAEKIFNLLKSVFPEVRSLSEHEPEIDFKEIDISGYKFALYLDTKGGKIGVMFFDKLTYEELKKFAKKINGEFIEENDRLICIAKEFGDEFNSEEIVTPEDDAEWDEQEKRMNQLDIVGHVDLIKEEKSGYSIMWID